MMVESYIRRGQRSLQRFLLDPRVRSGGMVLLLGGSGFFLSAASLGNAPQPLAAGLISAATGWRALVMSLGAMAGYPAFWGQRGNAGIVWSAAAGLLALLLGKREEAQDQPLMLPAIAAFLAAVTQGVFALLGMGELSPVGLPLGTGLAFLTGVLFTQAKRCRDAVTDWLCLGLGVLALARVAISPNLGLGYIAAGLVSVYSAFPAAALGGLALDLARVTAVPMTAVMCLTYFIRLIPFDKRWQHYAAPGAACIVVLAACGIRDLSPLPGLFLGGAAAALLPARPEMYHRRGQTGAAQVRLELGAEVLGTMEQLLLEVQPPPVDVEALLDRVRDFSCAGCSARRSCTVQLSPHHLDAPLDADCRKQGRLLPELRRAQEQRRAMAADRQRQREYRRALGRQYGFMRQYLRELSDQLPRRGERVQMAYRVEASARSRGKHRANGDRCQAFSGPGGKYYVVLCDGMGTGLGAAWEGESALTLLRRMLTAGFPPDHALQTLNDTLALRGAAGAVTVDLAEVRLDTGHAWIHKWGAAPSYLLTRGRAEKIGTAAPPPGLDLESSGETVEKLSLRRGEVLILLSDGVEVGEDLRLDEQSPDLPPGDLAARILEMGRGTGEDDATAAVIRLRPLSMEPS